MFRARFGNALQDGKGACGRGKQVRGCGRMEDGMKAKGHMVYKVLEGSIAQEMGIEAGDRLLEINGEGITDIFDYQYLMQDEYVEVLLEKAGGEEWLLEIDKEYGEDLGIEFGNGLMDEYRSCCNKCIFCFIDQMPAGMRESLYFKDDDSRLSFLQGNYVTLTNMSDYDVERIIRYRLSPINISFQTTNPALRCRMLNNRFAGEALKKADRLFEAGIGMNGQIVLCKGVNDGAELERSISDLSRYLPYLESVSVVPVGLSKYREGLYPLEPFGKEDAEEVLRQVHGWQERIYAGHGLHFVHASDEWYILAGQGLPEAGRYDGYPQLGNGVGMLRLLLDEFEAALGERIERERTGLEQKGKGPGVHGGGETISLATGQLAYPYIADMARRLEAAAAGLRVLVYPIANDFFGRQITVSGLLTGQDIVKQLAGRELGSRLLLPENVLRSGERVFLDDMTVGEMEKALQVKVDIVKSSGRDFVDAIWKENW